MRILLKGYFRPKLRVDMLLLFEIQASLSLKILNQVIEKADLPTALLIY
jgi:hypothetical protein